MRLHPGKTVSTHRELKMKKGSKRPEKSDFQGGDDDGSEQLLERLMKLVDLQSRAIESLALAVGAMGEATEPDDDEEDEGEDEENDEEKEDK